MAANMSQLYLKAAQEKNDDPKRNKRSDGFVIRKMRSGEFVISSEGLKRANLFNCDRKFTFIVGKNMKEYECSLFQACFISKRFAASSIAILPLKVFI